MDRGHLPITVTVSLAHIRNDRHTTPPQARDHKTPATLHGVLAFNVTYGSGDGILLKLHITQYSVPV